MTLEVIESPSLYTRAAVSSINSSKRTFDVIFTTGAAVERTDWTGKRYREVLSTNEKHVRLDRLNNGGPFLNSHFADSISDVIGVVEAGSARMVGGQGVATVRMSQRDQALDALWQDIEDRIVGAVSVGYRTYKLVEEAGKDGGLPTRTAVDWEPFELSLVSMPADTGAKIRGGVETNVCEISYREVGISAALHGSDADFRRDVLQRLEVLETQSPAAPVFRGHSTRPPGRPGGPDPVPHWFNPAIGR